jgi:crotonobetainyl-CoA:carnitine CoA-transferase CaiB-like acyl-CoA transferase
VKLSRTPGDATRPAPALGEHTADVLTEAGFSSEEVGVLIDSGAVAGMSAEADTARFMG